MIADHVFQFAGQFRVFLEIVTGIVLALADAGAAATVPGAGFFDQRRLDAQIDNLAQPGSALAVKNLELGLLKGWRQFVFDHLDSGFVADDLVAFLDRAGAADIQPHRGVELEGIATGCGFRRTKHDADLHPDLIDKNNQGVGALDVGGELAQRLAHQAGVQADVRITHVAFDLGLGSQRRHRIDHHGVHRAGTHQHVGDFQRLLAGVGLGDQQIVHVDAQFSGVNGVQGVFGIDEGGTTTQLLGFGDDLKRQGGFAGGFGSIDFGHPPTRQATDAQGDIQAERAGGNGHHVTGGAGGVAHSHDRALAKLALDLGQRARERLFLIVIHSVHPLGIR